MTINDTCTESNSKMSPSDKEALLPTSLHHDKARSDFLSRVGAALFYGIASFMITVVNKHVLTVHKFPSFQVSTCYLKILLNDNHYINLHSFLDSWSRTNDCHDSRFANW